MAFFEEFRETANTSKSSFLDLMNTEYEVRYTNRSLANVPEKVAGAVEDGVRLYQGVNDIQMNRAIREHQAGRANRADWLQVAESTGRVLRRIFLGV